MPLEQNSTGARRCLSIVALCAVTSICSRVTHPRDTASLLPMLLEATGLLEARSSLFFRMVFVLPPQGYGNLQASSMVISVSGMRLEDSSSYVMLSPARASFEQIYCQEL